MKKLIKGLICAGLILVTAVIPSIQTRAQEEENRILTGVYVEEMSLEGKTKSEAKSLVETYVESLSEKMITLIAVGEMRYRSKSLTLACIGVIRRS